MGKEIKVLLVDDEPDFTATVAFWMKKEGYAVTVAKSGEEALPLLRQQRPDIVFLDKTMPGAGGPATLRKIKEFDASIPVVMMSAYVGDLEKKETDVDTSGIAGIFYKGDDFSKLTQMIRSILK